MLNRAVSFSVAVVWCSPKEDSQRRRRKIGEDDENREKTTENWRRRQKNVEDDKKKWRRRQKFRCIPRFFVVFSIFLSSQCFRRLRSISCMFWNMQKMERQTHRKRQRSDSIKTTAGFVIWFVSIIMDTYKKVCSGTKKNLNFKYYTALTHSTSLSHARKIMLAKTRVTAVTVVKETVKIIHNNSKKNTPKHAPPPSLLLARSHVLHTQVHFLILHRIPQ